MNFKFIDVFINPREEKSQEIFRAVKLFPFLLPARGQ